MLLALLSKEEKTRFVDLLTRVVHIDGEPTEIEKKIYNRLKTEMGEDVMRYRVSTLSIDKLIEYFSKKSQVTKRIVYLNIVSMCFNDELYTVEDYIIIEKIQTAFEISEKKKHELMKVVFAERDLREKARRIISE